MNTGTDEAATTKVTIEGKMGDDKITDVTSIKPAEKKRLIREQVRISKNTTGQCTKRLAPLALTTAQNQRPV